MSFKLLLVSALFAVALSKIITYKDCGSESGKINFVDVEPCPEEPCVLDRGHNYTVNVNFTALANSSTAKTVVHGIIAGVPVPFPVPSDCCNQHNLKCPVVMGPEYYTNSLFCSPSYPKIKLVVQWEIKDDEGRDFVCFEAPLIISDPSDPYDPAQSYTEEEWQEWLGEEKEEGEEEELAVY